MRNTKTHALLYGCVFLEGKIGRQEEICNERQTISYGVRYIIIDELLQHPVNNIMRQCYNNPNYTKSDNLEYCFLLF